MVATRPSPKRSTPVWSYVHVTTSVAAAEVDVALVTRFRTSYTRTVVAPLASVTCCRFPAASYEYVVVPVTGLTCVRICPKSSYAYAVTLPFGSVTAVRFPWMS